MTEGAPAATRKLAEISSEYTDRLQVLAADLESVRAALPADAVLIEFRQFRPPASRRRCQTWRELQRDTVHAVT